MAHKVMTANRLEDGEVVYLTAERAWSTSLENARVFDGEEDEAAAQEIAADAKARRLVVDTYLFPVRHEDGGIMPISKREIIRAAGPSVRKDLGKQADGSKERSDHVPL